MTKNLGDNVVLFPKSPKRRLTKKEREHREATVARVVNSMIDLDSSYVIDTLIQELELWCDFNGNRHKKDLGLLQEAIKSIICRERGQPHFLHSLSDTVFDITPDGASLNTNVHFNFRKNSKK